MRLKQFLQESITQFEFRDVLANKNLLAGCEFEFYLDKDTDIETNPDDKWTSREGTLTSQIQELNEELDEVRDKITEVQDRLEHISYGTDHYDTNKEMLADLEEDEERILEGLYNLNELLEDGGDEVDQFATLKKLKFPLDWNNVTTDIENRDPSIWKIVNDVSLKTIPELGVEVVTPTMQIGRLIDKIDEVFKWLKKNNCWTDNTCGFHVHVSLIPDKHNEIDPVKLMMFTEEGLVYRDFSDRIGNRMAKSLKSGHIDAYKPFSIDSVKELLNDTTSINKVNKDKMMGLHFVDLKKNHVEFRYMGAKDYHTKFEFVKNNVVNYGHWLSIACDKEYKRKDYTRKIANIVDSFNLVMIKLRLNACQYIYPSIINKKDSQQISKLRKIMNVCDKKIQRLGEPDIMILSGLNKVKSIKQKIKQSIFDEIGYKG